MNSPTRSPGVTLPRAFYYRSALDVAPALLGKVLWRRTEEGLTAGRIVETEAYLGPADPAAHSYKPRSPRTEVLYGPGGFAYVYLIYGMYACLNVACNEPGQPDCVLLRALEPLEGRALMTARRQRPHRPPPAKPPTDWALCGGPGKLCQAMAVDRGCYGADLLGDVLFLTEGDAVPPEEIHTSPRINIDYAGAAREFPWRFYVESPCLSVRKFSA
ncbi:MAG: DNA-3-methyladenine glycosylase [Oscillospiraceae bacterium]|jgi:DNA-3-methyladenine glycosylase|nr:DNA-3-methyladenine glycosylase [Oscillospiraceae bacterium]